MSLSSDVVGDTIAERVDYPGDVDQYLLTLAQDETVRIGVAGDGRAPLAYSVTLGLVGRRDEVAASRVAGAVPSAPLVLRAGTYALRVASSGVDTSAVGPYRWRCCAVGNAHSHCVLSTGPA